MIHKIHAICCYYSRQHSSHHATFSATGTGQWHHAQALQYNNITVSENDFLRYSYSITVFEKEKALRSFLSLFVPTAKLLQKILLVDFKQGEYEDEL